MDGLLASKYGLRTELYSYVIVLYVAGRYCKGDNAQRPGNTWSLRPLHTVHVLCRKDHTGSPLAVLMRSSTLFV